MSTDSPYPDLKKRHTMARSGRPWRDFKPPPSGPVWGIIQGFGSYWTLVAAIDLGISYLTVYSFSAENWSRPREEVQIGRAHV